MLVTTRLPSGLLANCGRPGSQESRFAGWGLGGWRVLSVLARISCTAGKQDQGGIETAKERSHFALLSTVIMSYANTKGG
jgi:hypothetical protein